MMKKLNAENIYALFDKIASLQKLYIPVDKGDIAQFDEYKSGMTLTEKYNTNRSAKDFFFPQTENLYEIRKNAMKLEIKDTRQECEDFVVFGVRGCDVRSFEILDRVFLVDPIDTYYKNRRTHATIISLACNRPEETCFCNAFGIDASDPGSDVTSWKMGNDYFFNANTDKGEKLFEFLGDMLVDCDEEPVNQVKSAIKTVMSKLPLADTSFEGMKETELLEHFNNEKWSSLSEACIGCGTCTFVCPTCQCYDIREFDTGNGVKKFRCWDSCMYSDFTQMAHGNPRTSQLERFRQRFMHKLVYFPQNNDGIFGCVGCGRCLAKCPISMNIVKVEKALEVKA